MVDQATGTTTTGPTTAVPPAGATGAGAARPSADQAARKRAEERRYATTDRGRPISRERPRALDTRLSIDDGVILLGIVLGGAAGWAAAAAMSPGDRLARRRSERPGYDGYRRMHETHYEPHVEADETPELIASSKVEGTAVYDRQGQKIGKVYNFMVGKRTGRVAYAVVSVGGFLGIGDKHHALPWAMLDYDEDKGGYVVDADEARLLHAPTHGTGEDALARQEHRERVRDYWSPEMGARAR